MPVIDLIWLSDAAPPPAWTLGQVLTARLEPREIASLVQTALPRSTADAWLFWDAALGIPNPEIMLKAYHRPGDAWHCGLRMGLAGLPGALDFVNPTWMLHCDPHPTLEATAWRLSLRCCLVRTAVLRALGAPHPAYQSIAAASLELGLRWIQSGAITRHLPWLLPETYQQPAVHLSLEDEIRVIYHRKGRRWAFWALLRTALTGCAPLPTVFNVLRKVVPMPPSSPVSVYIHENHAAAAAIATPRVTILIPTIDRYPYLRALLGQLRGQTIPPLEIIVIDQTASHHRDTALEQDFADLPLRLFHLDTPGQCISRNMGLSQACGDYILFLDDDVEAPSDLIENHLRTFVQFNCDSSSGVALVPPALTLDQDFQRTRTSDVFPTNNSMLTRAALAKAGLFDMQFDRGARADHDLGTRVYLSGGVMLLNHQIAIIHHHAPAGGLRTHRARAVTRASSRSSLRHRHIPSPTEIYLALRYFTARQVREMLLQRVIGTLFGDGSRLRKAAKALVSFLLLPDTLLKTRANFRKAQQMLRQGPAIPSLDQKIEHPPEERHAPAAAQF